MTLLEQSLCLLSGVSPEAEIRFRRAGILTCRQLSEEANLHFSAAHAARVIESFSHFAKAYEFGLAGWFVAHLPTGHRIRATRHFAENTVYYDVETNGTSRDSHITCITTLRGESIRTFVRGQNLVDFLEEWSAAKLLVGFNSKRFDTPIVCREFGLADTPTQIDLMDEAAYYGLRGGLKAIERIVGFVRKDVPCICGADAVEQWHRWSEKGDKKAFSALIAYNREDVLSLQHLANHLLCLSLRNALFFDI